jgi:hypothetical protein
VYALVAVYNFINLHNSSAVNCNLDKLELYINKAQKAAQKDAKNKRNLRGFNSSIDN